MLKRNRLKKDFFYKDRLIFGLDDPVANMSIRTGANRSSGKDIPPKTCFILPSIFKCVGTFSEIDFHFNMADRRLRRHLSQDDMNRGIGMLHSGLSQRHVANVLGVSQSVVSRMWNRFIMTGNVRHLHAGGVRMLNQ